MPLLTYLGERGGGGVEESSSPVHVVEEETPMREQVNAKSVRKERE